MNETVAPSKRLLIIEDDQELIDLLSMHLQTEGYHVIAAADGEAGLHAFQEGSFALVILDWMLPSMSGLDVLREVRKHDTRTPVLMLTARIKVLRRRIERAEELARMNAGDQILDLGPLKVDHGKRKVEVRGEPVQLTVKEYDLLHTLASRPGRTFSRRQLLDLVWDHDSDIYEHTVNSHINRLRNKVEENPNRPRLILTVWGIGYRFTEEFL